MDDTTREFPHNIARFYTTGYDTDRYPQLRDASDRLLLTIARSNLVHREIGLRPALTPQGLALALDIDQRNVGAQLHRLRQRDLVLEGSPLQLSKAGESRIQTLRPSPTTPRIDQLATSVPQITRGRSDSAAERRVTPTSVWVLVVPRDAATVRVAIWAADDYVPYSCLENDPFRFPYLDGPRDSVHELVKHVLSSVLCHTDIARNDAPGVSSAIDELVDVLDGVARIFRKSVATGCANSAASASEKNNTTQLHAAVCSDLDLIPSIRARLPSPGWIPAQWPVVGEADLAF